MGEAKRRKAIEPSYGRPKRGLIVCPPVEIEGSRLHARSTNLDPQELRVATLLWDRVVWPTSRAIHFESGPDEQFLEREGFLSRPEYTVWGDAAQGFVKQQVNAFLDLEKREPGLWSLAQGKNSLLVLDGPAIEGNNVQLNLYSAIPVPNEDVPLAEVLEFKRRRDAEFQAMRHELDTLVAVVKNAQNHFEELKKQIGRVDQACSDAIRVGSEWHFPVRLTNFKCNYEVKPIQTLAGALFGYASGELISLVAAQTTLMSIVGTLVATSPVMKISFDGMQWRGLRPRQGPFRYVYEFHREFF